MFAWRDQATQAYLGGDKALAKELGAKGRWHAQQMAAAHSEASDAIFRARNPAAKGVRRAAALLTRHSSIDMHSLVLCSWVCFQHWREAWVVICLQALTADRTSSWLQS